MANHEDFAVGSVSPPAPHSLCMGGGGGGEKVGHGPVIYSSSLVLLIENLHDNLWLHD